MDPSFFENEPTAPAPPNLGEDHLEVTAPGACGVASFHPPPNRFDAHTPRVSMMSHCNERNA